MPRRAVLLTVLAVGLVLHPFAVRAQSNGEITPQPTFEFHSGFWVNLHHFLYLQGRLRSSRIPFANSSEPDEATRPEFNSPASIDGLSPADLKAWNAAVDLYANDWSSRNLLLNSEMTIVNNRLAELETCASLLGKPGEACTAGLRPELVAALDAAAPIYRARWWPEHDRQNRAWIAHVDPLVRRFGSALSEALVDAYQRRWPTDPLRIDIVWYAGPLGSYTSIDPFHATISSHDSRNQDFAAFEILYHESSHTLAEGVNQAIAEECKRRGVPIPRDLWHAIVYYTTGELVRRTLGGTAAQARGQGASAGQGASRGATARSYIPYANVNGIYDRGWSNYQQLLVRYWQPYLDGQMPFDAAISRIIAAL